MKILCIADDEDKSLYEYNTEAELRGVNLIISCGDLPVSYLEYLVTMAHAPPLHVHGNHDERYSYQPPMGCDCIEDTVYDFHGLRILGLGGSMRYKDGHYMFTEQEMEKRIAKVRRNIVLKNGFDLLVTHAPAKGYGDLEDLPHRGFDCFNALMDKYHPKYMLHGHVHPEYGNFKREREHPSGTKIINVCGKYVLHVGKDEHPAEGRTGSLLYDLYKNVAMAGGKRRSHAVYTEEE